MKATNEGQCDCCRNDVEHGDHEVGCVNETIDLEHVEALAARHGADDLDEDSDTEGARANDLATRHGVL